MKAVAAVCLWLLLGPALQGGGKLPVDADRVIEDIRHLSSGALAGRGTGSPALEEAASYIAAKFAEAGVKPVPGHTYLQPFEITTGAVLRDAATEVSYTLTGEQVRLAIGDFLPFSFSGTTAVSAPIVFAGYGISARECGYDDYAGLDVRGKIVVILRHEPQEFEAESCLEGRVYTEHSQYLSKAWNARRHGAVGAVLIHDSANHSGPDSFEPFQPYPAPADAMIPYVQVKLDVARKWFEHAGRNLEHIQRQIDTAGEPASFAFPPELSIQMRVAIERNNQTVHNVVAYLPGRTDEYVVVGAHYDHLGGGEQYSLAPEQRGAVHPGADDNASGTAGVLALARALSGQQQPRRGVLFIAFAGEELGLLGSSYYVNHPLLPLDDAIAMINMDMIGRMRDKRVVVGGAASGDALRAVVEENARRSGIEVDTSDRAVYGSSDHTSFRARSVPVLFFFTGLHQDYHRPSDTWDKIDRRNIAALLKLVASVADDLRTRPYRVRFVSAPAKLPPAKAGGGGSNSRVNSSLGSHEPDR